MREQSVVRLRRPGGTVFGLFAFVGEYFDNAVLKAGLSVMCDPARTASVNVDAAHTNKVKDQPMRNAMSFPLLVGGILLAFAARASIAQGIPPDALIQSITHDVIDVIKGNGDAHDPVKVARLVEARIVPHFDFVRMSQLAMGRNWRLASPVQQQALVAEFKTLLVHTYSASLTLYRNQTIEFEPLRALPGDTDVTVRSVVKQPGAAPIHIYYDMEKTATGWKVYDVNIDGISLVITYRDTFASQVRELGVEGLIKTLAAKNHSNDMLFNLAEAQANAK